MLYQKEEFYEYMLEVYQTEFVPLIQKVLDQKISEYSNCILQAATLNQIRWNVETGAEAERAVISDFLKARLNFLSSIWLEEKTYYCVRAYQNEDAFLLYRYVFPGACLTTLPVLESSDFQTFLGWYHADTNEPFNPEEPITSDLELYARWEEVPQNKIKRILKLTPLAAIAVLGVALLVVDVRRNPKGR